MNSVTQKIYTKRGIVKENVFEGEKVLHVGCGNAKLPGATGVDRLPLPAVDVVHDLDKTPWPLEDSSVDVVFAHSILEHVDDVVAFFEEVWRVGKPGARVVVTVPHFRSLDAFTDPTHTHFFTARSLDYFTVQENSLANYQYSTACFEKIGFWYGWPQESKNPFARIFKRFMHTYPKFYDQYLSLLAPVKIIVWELEMKKP